MEQGRVEKHVLTQCFLQQMPVPDRMKNAPELCLGLELYLGAFFDLCSERQVGWGAGPLGWVAVHLYAEAHDFDEEQEFRLHAHMGALDKTYREYHESHSKKS